MGFFDLPEYEADDALDAGDEDHGFDEARTAFWTAGVVPVELLIARSDQAAVVVNHISAYPDGFEFTVNSYLRPSPRRGRRRHLHHPLMWDDIGGPGEPIPDETLRFGLAWPDGGRATNLDGWDRGWPDATEAAHGLESHGGGGSDREYSQEYWAWPVPGPGRLQFVVEWPAFGIDETRESIDGGLIVEASTRARPVWAEDADKPSHLSRGAVMRAAREDRAQGNGGFTDL